MIRLESWICKLFENLKISLLIQISIFILFILIPNSYGDSSYTRKVEFDWESIPGAISYEVLIEKKDNKIDKKTYVFETSTPSWHGKLPPGAYNIKLRSKDKRKVPGEWSLPSELNVDLDPVTKLNPVASSIIYSKRSDQEKIKLSWKEVGGASAYDILITSYDEFFKISKTIDVPNFELELPVAKSYKWSVLAKNENNIRSETITQSDFTVKGTKLSAVSIDPPESEFVRELIWDKPEFSETFEVKLSILNKSTKRWSLVYFSPDQKLNQLIFNKDWVGGKYQLSVKAKGALRQDSDVSKINFLVRNGDRSLTAETMLLLKKSIDRSNGWYGIASYFISKIEYLGKNYETSGLSNFSGIGGTGRLGLGFELPNKKWGFLSIADLSGFFYNGSNHTFRSFETNSTYQIDLDNSKLKLQLGLFIKELPDIIANPGTQLIEKESKVSGLGPHLGGEYWYSFNPKLGFQLNTHIYYNYKEISTPNKEELVPTYSYQVGFLGSYRLTPKLTGLMGYARRVDKISYRASVGENSFARSGDKNTTDISGDYLNFFAEWNF